MHSDPSGALVGGFFGAMMLLYAGIFVVGILLSVFWVVEIIDVARREFADPNAKVMWLLIVILLHTVGPIIYYFVGKKQGWLPGEMPMAPPLSPSPMSPRHVGDTWPPPPGSSY